MNPQENQGGPGPMCGGGGQAQQGAGADTASHGGHGDVQRRYLHGHGYGLAMAGPPWAAGYMAPWHGQLILIHMRIPTVLDLRQAGFRRFGRRLLGRRRGRRRRPLQEPRRWSSSTTDL